MEKALYMTIKADGLDALEDSVSDFIAEGYVPVGGVVITDWQGSNHCPGLFACEFIQPMVHGSALLPHILTAASVAAQLQPAKKGARRHGR